MLTRFSVIPATLALLFFALGCGRAEEGQPADTKEEAQRSTRSEEEPASGRIEPLDLENVRNPSKVTDDEIYTAGQPAPDAFKQLADRGIATIINLRSPDETDFNEKEVARKHGMAYYNPAIESAEDLGDEEFDKVRKILKDPSKRPVLLHCGGANRASEERAVEEAKAIGLYNENMEKKAKAYIAKHRKGS